MELTIGGGDIYLNASRQCYRTERAMGRKGNVIHFSKRGNSVKFADATAMRDLQRSRIPRQHIAGTELDL